MDVLAALIFLLRAVFGSLLSALILTPVVYLLIRILPRPSRLLHSFLAGLGYILLFVFVAHSAYFLSFYSCPSVLELPNWEMQCSPPDFGEVFRLSLVATAVLAPYLTLFFAAAFFVYNRVQIDSVFAKTYLAVLTFIVVMLLWVVVFPWSLERYLQLFY